MLKIEVPITQEGWDEKNERFIEANTKTLCLEHSLVSISTWESKWKKPFFSKEDKTDEETFDYIKCMTLTENVDPDVYNHLTKENCDTIYKYMNDSMTATTFSKEQAGKPSREIVTSELIYYWMITLNIPTEFQHWHIKRLLTLIQVCNIKNTPPKKMSRKEIASRNAAINAANRAKYHSKG